MYGIMFKETGRKRIPDGYLTYARPKGRTVLSLNLTILKTALSLWVVPASILVATTLDGIFHLYLWVVFITSMSVAILGNAVEAKFLRKRPWSHRFLSWSLISAASVYLSQFVSPLAHIRVGAALAVGIVTGLMESLVAEP